MRQSDLNREVARLTGESVSTIKRLGFLLDDPIDHEVDPDSPEYGPHVIDWDDFELLRQRDIQGTARPRHELAIV